MAGISPALSEMAFASGSPVRDQMNVLLSKAGQLLGHPATRQLQELINIGSGGVAMLLNVEDREINASRDLELWLEKVNAAILMASDVLDECNDESLANKTPQKYMNSCLGRPSMSSDRLESMNSKLRNELKYEDAISYGVPKGAPDGRSAAAQAMTDILELESGVVQGMEGDGVKTLVDKLQNAGNSTELSIVTLVGWAETGKEALAQLLYKNADVMSYYDERMWVQMPVEFYHDQEEKLAILRYRLKGKRFLLVLADARDLTSTRFHPLKEFLEKLGGSRGSKVLITTGPRPNIESSFVYQLKLDASDYCRRLFDEISFADGGPIKTSDLEEMGGTFVDICRGNSLYIKLLGSLLYRMKDVRQWQSIYEKLKDSSPGGIPKLCFDYMSSVPLKRCFQYCYFFPKGSLICKEELIELWMAQGYLDLPFRSGANMEALGQKYYDVLMRSSFFQVSEDDDFDINSCKIPDVLHGMDLFTESSRKCFKTIVKGDARYCDGAVHLTLILCHVRFSKSWKERFSKLRSLRLENVKGYAEVLGCAQGLHVLIIVDESLVELADSIGGLIHLRYLDISRTSIVRLPDSISELYNLQTLRLHDLQELPMNFEKLLINLMHLYIDKLEDLYEMYDLLSKCGKLVYLSSAKACMKLFVDKEGRFDSTMLHMYTLSHRCSTISIHCLENASKAAPGIGAWLSQIPKLESLKLNWSACRRENLMDGYVLDRLKPNLSLKYLALQNFKGTTFPSWMMMVDSVHISNLVNMKLENCSWCEKLPPLGCLSCLRILKIVGMDNVQSITAEFYGEDSSGTTNKPVFAKLREFTVCGMSKLKEWSGLTTSSTTAFPNLERFEVDQCPRLIGIPDVVLAGEQKYLRKFKVSLCKELTHLPGRFEEAECVEDLELFGLPCLEKFSLGCGNSLKNLILGRFSAKLEKKDMPKQLESLTSLTVLTLWKYGQESIPDCFGRLSSLEVLKFDFCPRLIKVPQIKSLKELHICYCPLLEDRCFRGNRPEWPKVSHIETIIVNNEKIREPQVEKLP